MHASGRGEGSNFYQNHHRPLRTDSSKTARLSTNPNKTTVEKLSNFLITNIVYV